MVERPPDGMGVDRSGGPVVDPTENVKDILEAAVKRQDDLRASESFHIRELMGLRADYEEKLRTAESERIDAIRAVDVGAVNRASDVQAAAAQALATQVTASADAMRNQVAAAAQAAAESLVTALLPLQTAIAELRQVQYEQAGQTAAKVDTRAGTSQYWFVASVIVAFFSMLIALGLGVVVVTNL